MLFIKVQRIVGFDKQNPETFLFPGLTNFGNYRIIDFPDLFVWLNPLSEKYLRFRVSSGTFPLRAFQ